VHLLMAHLAVLCTVDQLAICQLHRCKPGLKAKPQPG
jgi:hypothetical protein